MILLLFFGCLGCPILQSFALCAHGALAGLHELQAKHIVGKALSPCHASNGNMSLGKLLLLVHR